mgnify:CR=1 FL=1
MTFHCAALHSKAGADQISDEPCLRLATLLKATPSLPVSVHRRCMPRLCFAITGQCVTLPSPLVAQRVCAVAIRSLSKLGCSTPLRIGPLPVLRGAVRFLATPSPLRALLRSSFAELGSAVHFRRRAGRRHALLFRRLPEQIKALPLQRHSHQRHRAALPSHANPLPPTSSRCRRIALRAALRCSVAPPRYAAQIHRHTTPLTALPSRTIATLR